MENGGIVGTVSWIPASENGPTIPFNGPKLMAFAYVGDRHREDTPIVVRGLQGDGASCEVTAEWVADYAAPTVRAGDVITLVASQRPIARIEVTSVDTRT